MSMIVSLALACFCNDMIFPDVGVLDEVPIKGYPGIQNLPNSLHTTNLVLPQIRIDLK